MAKTELEVRSILPLDEVLLKHKVDAEHKAKEAFVLELLRQGDISAGKGGATAKYLTMGSLGTDV